MRNVACTKEYHDGLAKNPFAWRIKTHHLGYEVDTHETVELGCCRWCGRTLARAVWHQE
jgi:hypothetical protein